MNFGEQIWCALSEEMSFETFIPIWSNVNENEKHLAKIQKLKFLIYLNKFCRDLSQGYAYFWAVKLMQTFRGDVVLPYGPLLKKTKEIVKKQNCKILKKKNNGLKI